MESLCSLNDACDYIVEKTYANFPYDFLKIINFMSNSIYHYTIPTDIHCILGEIKSFVQW